MRVGIPRYRVPPKIQHGGRRMARKFRWWDDFPRTWWIEKILVPSVLIGVTGLVTTVVAPQVLYLRDQKLLREA